VNIAGALAEGLTPADNFLLAVTPDAEHDAFNRIASYVALLMIVITFAAAFAWWRNQRASEATGHREMRCGQTLLLAAAASLMMLRVTNVFVDLSSELALRAVPWRWMAILSVVFCAIRGHDCGEALCRTILDCARAGAYAYQRISDAPYLVGHGRREQRERGCRQRYGFLKARTSTIPLGDDHSDIPKDQRKQSS